MDGLAFTNPPNHYYASPPGEAAYAHAAFANNAAATTPAHLDAYAAYANSNFSFHHPADGVNVNHSPAVLHQPQQPYARASSSASDAPVYTYASPDINTHTRQTSASPASHFSNVAGHQQQHFNNSSTPPSHTSMAAPPFPQSPANAQPPSQPTATPSASQSPSSTTAPTGSTREARRMALLLEINEEILAEIQRLQADNQGGAISLQHQMSLKQNGQPDKMASEDYIQLLRRLQGNLAYMMPRSGQPMNPDTKVLAGPAFMQHPPPMPQLATKYEKLRELFPEWQGNDAKLMAGNAQSPTTAQQQTSMQQRMQQMQQMQQLQQKQLQQQQFQQASNSNGVAPQANNNMMQ